MVDRKISVARIVNHPCLCGYMCDEGALSAVQSPAVGKREDDDSDRQWNIL
jgi:hypothetical protein